MQAGAVAPDHKLLRQIGNLCHRLPAAGRGPSGEQGSGSEFEQAFLGEYSDGLVVTYLAAVSKLTSMAQDVKDKFAHAFADAGQGGHGHGHSHPHAGPSAHHRALGGRLGGHGGGAGGGRSRR